MLNLEGLGQVEVQQNGVAVDTKVYQYGDQLTLVAKPAEGWKLESWTLLGKSQGIETEATLVLVVYADTIVNVKFSPIPGPRIGFWLLEGFTSYEYDLSSHFSFEVHHDGTAFSVTAIDYLFRIYCDQCADLPHNPPVVVNCPLPSTCVGGEECPTIPVVGSTANCVVVNVVNLNIEFSSSSGGVVFDTATINASLQPTANCVDTSPFSYIVNRVAVPQ
jgi:hypothetical protein